jgi:hypothetical protein
VMVAKETGSLFLLTILKLTRCWAIRKLHRSRPMRRKQGFGENIHRNYHVNPYHDVKF